jgi:photosystem II stability/assembly factor-like uncharacterized protein
MKTKTTNYAKQITGEAQITTNYMKQIKTKSIMKTKRVLLTLLIFHFSLFTFHYSLAQTGTIQLPATGQTTSYYPGDDGDLQEGVAWPAQRFNDHGNGSATDNLTGLMWATDANLMASRDPDFDTDRTPGDGDVNWATAVDYINKLNNENYLGYNDWRLPNLLDLRSLIDLGKESTALPENHPFTNLKEGYWSSTTSEERRSHAACVFLKFYYVHSNIIHPAGETETFNKKLEQYLTNYWAFFVLPVRNSETTGSVNLPVSGQRLSFLPGDDGSLKTGIDWPSPRLIDNKDSTVTDRLTGLMWVRNANLMASRDPEFDPTYGDGQVPWDLALDYVAKLNTESYLGYTDWRLPNRNELLSLIDFGASRPALPGNHPFINTFTGYGYWSSSTLARDENEAWPIAFEDGMMGGCHANFYSKNEGYGYFVWPVRNDNSSLPSGSLNGTINGNDIPLKGFEITIDGPVAVRTETDIDGHYEFTGLPDGDYTVRASKMYFRFVPGSHSITVAGAPANCSFTAYYTRAYGWTDISENLFAVGNVPGQPLTDLHFINDSEGWIPVYGGTILHTTDGGQSFDVQNTFFGNECVHSIYMKDSLEGYAAGQGGYIYKYNATGNPQWDYLGELTGTTLTSVTFKGETGWVCGINGWVANFDATGIISIEKLVASDLQSITFPVDHTEGWVCGESIMRHYVEGQGWLADQYYNLNNKSLSSIYFVDTDNGWTVGSQGLIIHTEDGQNWDYPTFYFSSQFNDVFFLNSTEGWAVGYSIPLNGGIILHTTNGGTTWNIQADDLTNKDLAAIQFTSPTNGYAVGCNGILLKYTLLEGAPGGADILDVMVEGQIGQASIDTEEKTVHVEVTQETNLSTLIPEIFLSAGATADPPGGIMQDFTNPVIYTVTSSDGTIINDWTVTVIQVGGIGEEKSFSKDFGLMNYPNPFSQLTITNYELRISGNVVLKIYDVFGNEVRMLVDEYQEAGEYEVEFDGSGLPSGVYYCRLMVGKYSQTKKMILVR